MRLGAWRAVRALAAAIACCGAPATAFQCPGSTDDAPPERTLTMDCRGACADEYSPCLYYADASDCQAQLNDTSSECVWSEDENDDGQACAFECFYPFSGADNATWNLMATNQFEYKVDVRAWKSRDPDFHIAKKPDSELSTASDLTFPPGTTLITISGNAMPIDIKAVNYIVLDPGESANFSVAADALANATDCRDLRIENINMEELTTFPALPNLERLILSNVQMHGVPDGLANLTNITYLDLSQNSFGVVPDGSIPLSVVDLCLLGCGLKTVPSEILQLPELVQLDLSGNQFALPSAGSLPLQLETFIYYDMYQATLPPDVIDMKSLKRLDIGWNSFEDPSVIEPLPPTLTHLGLSGNFLPDLPASISDLVNLRELDISTNSFRGVAPTSLPPNLTLLNASSNSIESLPDNLLPPSLEFLNLSYNNIADSLPVGFDKLQNLTELYLDGNAFTTIPSVIFSLSSLRRLSLSSDQSATDSGKVTLTEAQIEFLSNLEVFTVDGNDVAAFFSTACDSPAQVHNYSVCLAGSTATASDDDVRTSSSTSYTWVYITAPVVVGLILALVGFLIYRRRQRRADSLSEAPDSKEARSLFFIDSHLELAVTSLGDATVTNSAFFSVAKTPLCDNDSTASSNGVNTSLSSRREMARLMSMASSMSIWDDEDLLKARIDFQQIHNVELLSTGFYGEVWLATYMDAYVAVKRLKRRNAERREILRFIAEIKAHARFDHPKIVTFVGVAWTMESDVEAVVEYMEGGDLHSYLSTLVYSSSSSTEEKSGQDAVQSSEVLTSYWDYNALTIAMDIVEALVYLHSLDPAVLHRDLKSRNVLLDGELRAKITDFGVSTESRDWADFDDENMTASVVAMTSGVGTARWAAPEVLSGSDWYTTSVDIYSFGVILSELDTRRTPFSERTDVPENFLLSQIAAGEVQPELSCDAPAQLVDLARRCMSFDASKRPTAVEAAYLLRVIRQDASGDKVVTWRE